MEEKTRQDELVDEVELTASKAWLKNTDKSIARLQNVKKTYYRLGGGPKEREVDCSCNYRSKHRSSFVNMDADPPQLSQESQETASHQNVSISDLVKAQKNKNKPAPKPKRRPYSATVRAGSSNAPSCEVETSSSNGKKAFIAVKGQNLNPKSRPTSASHIVPQSSIGCLWHLDPDHVQREHQVKMEGMRKYSAYGQDDDMSTGVGLPIPPRVSPDIPPDIIDEKKHDISPEQSSSDDFSEDNDKLENELQPTCDQRDHVASKPLIFQIPTAELYDFDGDDTARYKPEISGCSKDPVSTIHSPSRVSSKGPTVRDNVTPRGNDRALSADYVEKSEVFLDELERKQTQETEELTEMFDKMNQNQEKIDGIDLRSVMTTPSSARHVTTPNQDTAGVSILNIALRQTEQCTEDFTGAEPMWVEEPYVSKVKSNQETTHVPMGRFHCPNRRVQSAKTRRRSQEEGAFVLRGKTVELMDAKDLSVPRKLSDKTIAGKEIDSGLCPQNEVFGKPPRPKSSSSKRKARASSASANVRQRKAINHENKEQVLHPPHPPTIRRSSLRKSLSQGDVRCLSPEVIASVKKTVSFSDEVLDKPTRLVKLNNKEGIKEVDQVNDSVPEAEVVIEPEAEIKNSLEEKSPVMEHVCNRLDIDEDTLCSNGPKNDVKPSGVIIQNWQEAMEHFNSSQQRPINKGPMVDKPMNPANVIAKVKEATRCSCHVEECHCREITRPTMAVISQAKSAAKEQWSPPKQKLLKHRPSRPTSAPIRKTPSSSAISNNQARTRQSSTTQPSGIGVERKPRPVSAHIKRASVAQRRPNSYRHSSSKDSKSKTTRAKTDQIDIGFVWGPGSEDVAASEECQEVYAKFKEKGINVSMETVKRGLMAPARRASESCMASFGSSSSSGLLSRPEKWLPEEYKRVKIWDNVLKKL